MCWMFWPRGMWDLTPQPRIEHTLLALEGEVLTIGPPEKSPFMFSVMIIFTWLWFPICYTLGGREHSWATMWSPILSFWLHRKPSHFQQFSWYSQNIHMVRAPSPQLCPTLCDPMDCSFSVHRILQARILWWAAISFSRGSSQPRDQTHVSCIAGGLLTHWAIRELHMIQHRI